MSAIRDAGKVKARERIAVLAALNLAYLLAERPIAAQADGSGAVVLEAVEGQGQLLGWDLDADGSAERSEATRRATASSKRTASQRTAVGAMAISSCPRVATADAPRVRSAKKVRAYRARPAGARRKAAAGRT